MRFASNVLFSSIKVDASYNSSRPLKLKNSIMTSSNISDMQAANDKLLKQVNTAHYVLTIEGFACGQPQRRVCVDLPKPYRLIVPMLDVSLRQVSNSLVATVPSTQNFMSAVFKKLGIDLRAHIKMALKEFLAAREDQSQQVQDSMVLILEKYLQTFSNIKIKELEEAKNIPLVDLEQLPELLSASKEEDYIESMGVLKLILRELSDTIIDTAKNSPPSKTKTYEVAPPCLDYISGAAVVKILGHDLGYLFVEDGGRTSRSDLNPTVLAHLQQQFTRRMESWIECGISSDYSQEIRTAYLFQARALRRVIDEISNGRVECKIVMAISSNYDRSLSKEVYENMHSSMSTMYRSKNTSAQNKFVAEIMAQEGTLHSSGLCT